MKAIFVAPHCGAYEIELPAGSGDEGSRKRYEMERALVGGLIDVVQLGDGLEAIINDEGLLNGLQPNIKVNGALLVGNMIIIREPSHDSEGNEIDHDTTPEDLAKVNAMLKRVERPGVFNYDIPPARILVGKDFDDYMAGKREAPSSPGVKIASVDTGS